MAASIENLAPFVEESIFTLEVDAERKDTHFCFHLDYEAQVYRERELANLIRDSVEYFALTHDEFENFRTRGDFVSARRVAWSRISTAMKDKKGDYGELLLFLILNFKLPVKVPRFVTKVRLRSSRGDQIKGFDCAHFTIENDEICLWLGEAKFHQSISGALSSAMTSLGDHWENDYLKNEIKILGANIEANHGIDQTIKQKLDAALNKGRSIDRLRFKVPILLTYDSVCVKGNMNIETNFRSELLIELNKHFKTISEKNINPPANFSLLFILMPFNSVASIKSALETIEGAMQ